MEEFDWSRVVGSFILAMTEWKLGRESEARACYDRAVTRMNEIYPRDPSRILLRDEAEVLGIQS